MDEVKISWPYLFYFLMFLFLQAEDIDVFIRSEVDPTEVFRKVNRYVLGAQEGYFGDLMRYNVISAAGHTDTALKLGDGQRFQLSINMEE
jgi:hypothetical protein